MRDFLQAQSAGLPGEVTIQVSALDPNNQLPACAALEPFLPAATRAWGRISVGVRCDSPVTWTAYVQAQVSVLADYLVAARPLRAGQIVGPADLGQRRGDLTALADNILTDSTQAMGHTTRFAVAAGTPLRGGMLRVPHAVRQGQTVPVIDASSGEIRRAQIFVAVLGASNYTYSCATATQTTADWVGSIIAALEFMGGTPRLIVPDQPRALIARPDRYEPAVNRLVEELEQHYAVAVLPARPGRLTSTP